MKTKAQIKDTYRHHSTHMLESVVRMNGTKGEAIERDLASGAMEKRWAKVVRKSGNAIDVREKLAEISDLNQERLAVAEACRELLSERTATT